MRSSRSAFPRVWSTFRSIPNVYLVGVGLMLTSTGCGSVSDADASDNPSQPTLDATVITDADPGGDVDDLITPAGVDDEFGPLSFTAEPAFCCDPLAIEFAVQPAESAAADGVAFHWDFGDGRAATGHAVQHTFPWAGEYVVALTAHWPDKDAETAHRTLLLGTDDDGSTGLIASLAAEAGPNQVVYAGELVLLDGGASRPTAGGALTYSWVQSGGPDARLEGTDQPTITFIAPNVASGQEALRFELTVTDGELDASDEVVVTVLAGSPDIVTNVPPSASDQRTSVLPDTPTWMRLSGYDADDDALDFLIVSAPSHGTLGEIDNSRVDSATVLYTPDMGFEGEDAFTFQANDGLARSAVATVTVTVGENAQPQAFDGETSTYAGVPVQLALWGSDPEGQELTFFVVSGPSSGMLGPIDDTSEASAVVTYTPAKGFVGTATFTFVANDGLVDSQAAVFAISVRRILVPRLEVNSLDPDLLDVVVAGLLTWQRVTDTAIISTLPGRTAVYQELQHRVPGMTIIPGLKTSPVFGRHDFDNVALWPLYAEQVDAACRATGQSRLYVENESALKAYYAGEDEIDFDLLRQGLAELPADIEYYWYPSVAESGETLARYVQLCAAVDEVLNVRFIDHATLNTPECPSSVGTLYAVAQLEAVATQPTIPQIYCTEGKWPFEDIPEALDYVGPKWGNDAWAIIYPGLAYWQSAADVITAVLPENP